MNKNGPILVIDDDPDDKDFLVDIFKTLDCKNKVLYFNNGNQALEYLTVSEDNPFLILSDINMPALNGFELKEKILTSEELRLKCIPYVFFTTSSSQKTVIDAYSKSGQGFFVKPNSSKKLERTIRIIIEYWQESEAPAYIR